jgi:hypothetical protein
VLVGGTGVFVFVNVFVDVFVGGIGVFVFVGVNVGGTGVFVFVNVFVRVGVFVGEVVVLAFEVTRPSCQGIRL